MIMVQRKKGFCKRRLVRGGLNDLGSNNQMYPYEQVIQWSYFIPTALTIDSHYDLLETMMEENDL